ncbi:hypothetical protein L1987_39804 [Smallanthus sonchifolius]|uniref:Uncharacterized protein n=1 Tax=Smallanthus sonchifolius TaxID=185202 RepID=A0ACB9HQJ7_9ASTR|nr:hypothetical protein L1987_39804 [Smallanthus sonchifolius]
MLRKKDQPPSALPSRRSARGAAKSASTEGEEVEAPALPSAGLGESQKGPIRSPQPPSLVLPIEVCNTNKENSTIPSVTVSLNDSEQDAGMDKANDSAKKSYGIAGFFPAGNLDSADFYPVGKSTYAGTASLAGMSALDSSGSPGVQSNVPVHDTMELEIESHTDENMCMEGGELPMQPHEVAADQEVSVETLHGNMHADDDGATVPSAIDGVALGLNNGTDMVQESVGPVHVSSVEKVNVGLDSSEGVDMHAHEKGVHNVGIIGGKKVGKKKHLSDDELNMDGQEDASEEVESEMDGDGLIGSTASRLDMHKVQVRASVVAACGSGGVDFGLGRYGLACVLGLGLSLDGVGLGCMSLVSCWFESRGIIGPRMVGVGWDGARLGFTCAWDIHAWGCLNLGLI